MEIFAALLGIIGTLLVIVLPFFLVWMAWEEKHLNRREPWRG